MRAVSAIVMRVLAAHRRFTRRIFVRPVVLVHAVIHVRHGPRRRNPIQGQRQDE
jgi:hypothetical protein